MRLGIYIPAAVILLADTLPGAVSPESSNAPSTRYRVGLGYGVAEYEDKSFSCSGELLDSWPVDLRGGGGLVEVRRGSFRASGFLGSIAYDEGFPDYAGTYGGVVLAGEWRGFGLGGGVGGISGTEATALPSFYLRVGALDAWHGRLEFFPPTETLAGTGWLRLGMAYRRGIKPGWGGALGLSLAPYSYLNDEFQPRLFGDLDVPLGSESPVYGVFRVQIGAGEERTNWSASGGLRIDFGSGP